jgi:hypothetical protein
VVVFMSDPKLQKALKKKFNYRTYKSYEARMDELREAFQVEDFKQFLSELVEEKINYYQKMIWV